MEVRAKLPEGKFAFYGTQRRYDGDVFTIEEGQFSKRWMEIVDEEKPKRRGRPPKEKEEGGE